jgi:hypothetical protein
MIQIERLTDLIHFIDLSPNDTCEIEITFEHGIYSKKTISYDKDEKLFTILNHVDGEESEVKLEDIFDKTQTNVGIAIVEGALYIDEYQYEEPIHE